MLRESGLTKLAVISLLGIPLFLSAIVGILNSFQDEMNLVDTLVTDVAPNLLSQQGDLVRVVAIFLLLVFCIGLPVSIELAAKKYLG